MLMFHEKIKVQSPVKADMYFEERSTMTTCTTMIMQMSQDHLKPGLKTSIENIVDYKVK